MVVAEVVVAVLVGGVPRPGGIESDVAAESMSMKWSAHVGPRIMDCSHRRKIVLV